MKQLEHKYKDNSSTTSINSNTNTNTTNESGSEDVDNSNINNTAHNLSSTNHINLKTFYFLISTMNNMFPDYDFSEIPSEAFTRITSLSTLINHFNTSIFNTGIDRNTMTFAEFTRKMWNCMDDSVGGLDESEIFTFDPEPFELDDPFRDQRGTM